MQHLTKFKSSNVASAEYDPAAKSLTVKFKGTAHSYHYKAVAPETWAGLEKAESKGAFLRQHVIGKHLHIKLPHA